MMAPRIQARPAAGARSRSLSMKTWMGAELAAATERTLDALSAALLRASPARAMGPTWAWGTAGQALAHARLAARFPRRGHARRAAVLLQSAVRDAGAARGGPFLFEGLAGIAWVVDRLAGSADDHDPNARIDEALCRMYATGDAPPSYELVRGSAGIGTYALGRPERPQARALVAHAFRHLASLAEPVDGGLAFRADALWNPVAERVAGYVPGARCYDLGVAHGAAGVLPFLVGTRALAARDRVPGLRAVEVERLLRGVLAFVLAHARPVSSPPRARFARYVGADAGAPTAHRPAWCYGDPGMAIPLLLAARSVGDARAEAEVLGIARHAAALRGRWMAIEDAALCHGTSGLAHVYHRLFELTGEPVFARAARHWLRATLRCRTPGRGLGGYRSLHSGGWRSLPGVLHGTAGVALALDALLSGDRPDWDAPLGLCVPALPRAHADAADGHGHGHGRGHGHGHGHGHREEAS